MVRGKHARRPTPAERLRQARPFLAAGAGVLAIAVIIGLALVFPAVSPGPNAYEGQTALTERSLPQAPTLLEPTTYAETVLGVATEPETPPTTADGRPIIPATPPTGADLATLENRPGIFSFCTADPAAAPVLDGPLLAALTEAAAPLATQGDTTGYLFMDLATGAGVASNIDTRYYAASTIKGPFAVFVSQTIIDGVPIALSDTISIGYAGDYLEEGVSSLEVQSLIDEAIRYSDNDAYRVLRANFEQYGWQQWIASLGLNGEQFINGWYPDVSVRDQAILWLTTYDYLKRATPTAQWLETLFTATDTSFIRRGLADEGVTVENKAGWITGYPADAINDCGLIRTADTTYLMVILSNGPEGEPTEGSVAAIAKALYNTRTAFPAAE